MKFSLTGFHFTFTPSRRMFLLTLVFMAIFVRLGFWQLERGHEKELLLSVSHKESIIAPVGWGGRDSLPKPFQSIKVQGHFPKTTLLLDNQHYQHKFGYDVLSPLIMADGSVVLVDRGWIASVHSRQNDVHIAIPKGEQLIIGNVYYPSKKSWILGQALEELNSHTAIVELVDNKVISEFLHKPVYPFVIRLNKAQNNGYIREWSIVSMPPARHYGYAVQWFAIALVIGIIFIALNLKVTRGRL